MGGTLTIAAVPKPFSGDTARIQRNAIRSWQALPCQKQVLLLGGEDGTAKAAREVGALALPEVDRDRYGTPRLDSVFGQIAQASEGDAVVFVNADIILTSSVLGAIAATQARFREFLMVAKRWNLDLDREIDFESRGWEVALESEARERGALFAPQAIDLFVFARGQYAEVPPFAIGRSYWDNWFISTARRAGVPVVDATESAMIIHQNHRYAGFSSLAEIRRSPQGRRNFHLLGDSHYFLGTTRDATHRVEEDRVVPAPTQVVSVVIPHAGPLGRLKGCLRALSYQSYPRTFIEIIVVCNDTSCDIGVLSSEFPFVRVCRELTPGPAAGRNTGAACATGEVLAFVDSDCMPTSEWITNGMAALMNAGPRSIVAGAIEQRTGTPRGHRNGFEAFASVTFLQQERQVAYHGTCVSANLFVRTEDYWSTGGFDESFREASGEDWDWSQRAGRGGLRILYGAEATVLHPALGTYRQVVRKVRRTVRGNARLWMRQRDASESAEGRTDEQQAIGPPTLRKLLHRVTKLARDPRLSRRERVRVAAAQIAIWPAAMAEWRRVVRELEAHPTPGSS